MPDDRPLLEADPEAAVEVVREDQVRLVSVRDVGGSVEAPVDAEAAAERLRGLDDPRLDHDLRCRRVQVVDQLQYGRQESRDLADDEGVRPRVDHDVAATRHDALQNRNDLGGARVRQLLDDRAGGLRGLTRLREPRPVGLLDPELLGRRDPHDVVFEHVTEVVLLQDQVEGLVPGNVLELDGDGALDVRIDDDVQPGELRDRAKDVLDVGVLQVERDRLARELLLATRPDRGRQRRRSGRGQQAREHCRNREPEPRARDAEDNGARHEEPEASALALREHPAAEQARRVAA